MLVIEIRIKFRIRNEFLTDNMRCFRVFFFYTMIKGCN